MYTERVFLASRALTAFQNFEGTHQCCFGELQPITQQTSSNNPKVPELEADLS